MPRFPAADDRDPTDDALRRLEAIERVAGATSHEINNMLTVVLAHAGLLQLDPSPQHVDRHAVAMEEAAARAAALAADLRDLAGRAGGQRAHGVELGAVVAALGPLLDPLGGQEWRCSLAPSPDCLVLASRGRLEHLAVLMLSEARSRFLPGGDFQLACRRDHLPSGAPAVVLSCEVQARSSAAESSGPVVLTAPPDGIRLALLRRAADRNAATLVVHHQPARLTIEVFFPAFSPEGGAAPSGSA